MPLPSDSLQVEPLARDRNSFPPSSIPAPDPLSSWGSAPTHGATGLGIPSFPAAFTDLPHLPKHFLLPTSICFLPKPEGYEQQQAESTYQKLAKPTVLLGLK